MLPLSPRKNAGAAPGSASGIPGKSPLGAASPAAVVSGTQGAPRGHDPCGDISPELEKAATRFICEACCWRGAEDGALLSKDLAEKVTMLLLAPDCVVHPDGLLGSVPPLVGPSAFLDFIAKERAAYRTVELTPLLVAASNTHPHPHSDNAHQQGQQGQEAGAQGQQGGPATAVFVLSAFKVQNVGRWCGKEPTNNLSEGVRIDELHLDTECKVVEAWCNRQMFEEERLLLLRDPATHHAAAFDRALLHQVPAHENGSTGPLAPHKLLQVATVWAEAWNVATASGSMNPDLLDNLVDEHLALYDMYGMVGDSGQDHPFSAIKSRCDAKRVLVQVSDAYDVDENVVRMAARSGFNAAFTHWRARLTPRTPASIAARQEAAAETTVAGPGPSPATAVAAPAPEAGLGGGTGSAAVAAPAAQGTGSGGSKDGAAAVAGSGGAQHGEVPCASFVAEAVDLVLFSESGRISAICQFRRPLGSDRRRVLADLAPASSA